jgi:hypothetical protein
MEGKTLMFVERGAAYAHQMVPLTYIRDVKYQGFSSPASVGEVQSIRRQTIECYSSKMIVLF